MIHNKPQQHMAKALCVCAALVCALGLMAQLASAVITVQIGGATRLNTISRQRERYNCYWDCDLVGCQIARDDDECAYDCEKICRVRYDYAGRTGAASNANAAERSAPATGDTNSSELKPKSAAAANEQVVTGGSNVEGEQAAEMLGAGTSVRLHLPRNASARNFAIWERCTADASTGKLTEKPFNL